MNSFYFFIFFPIFCSVISPRQISSYIPNNLSFAPLIPAIYSLHCPSRYLLSESLGSLYPRVELPCCAIDVNFRFWLEINRRWEDRQGPSSLNMQHVLRNLDIPGDYFLVRKCSEESLL